MQRNCNLSVADSGAESFRRFDRRGCGHWDGDDCRRFVEQGLLGRASSNMAAEALARELFARFERGGRIGEAEFERLWTGVVRPLARPAAALLVVDVQNDFVGGSLAVPGGAEVVPLINAMIREVPFAAVAYSMDWHPDDHISFHDNLHLYELGDEYKDHNGTKDHKKEHKGTKDDKEHNKGTKDHKDDKDHKRTKDHISMFDSVRFAGACYDQTLWPKHCVQDTWGARLHPDLALSEGAVVVKKGQDPRVDSYSAFFDNARRGSTPLEAELRARGVTMVVVCGLALDFCVGHTALDALTLGLPTVVVRDASRGTDRKKTAEMEAEVRSRRGVMADAREVRAIVEGRDIREEFVRVLLAKYEAAS